MTRNTATHLRANPKFAALVKRLAREGSAAERRTVTFSEVTGLLASLVPPTWAALRANSRASIPTKG